jgi:hypothetical protein
MDKSPHFTPLESPAIYGRGVERNCSFVMDKGIKTLLFLTGAPANTDIETEDIHDAPTIRVRSSEPQTHWAEILFSCVKDKL